MNFSLQFILLTSRLLFCFTIPKKTFFIISTEKIMTTTSTQSDTAESVSTNGASRISTSILFSKTTLTGTLHPDHHLEVVPKHLFRLKSYLVTTPLSGPEDYDLAVVKTGWRYLKRMDSRFDLASQEPSHEDYVSGLRFLRELVNCAVNLYLEECEQAIVRYARDHWKTPPSKVDSITSFEDVLFLVHSTMTEDQESPYWSNWTNLFMVYKELWDENLVNERCARSFVYRYLNELYKTKTCPSRRRNSPNSDINGEFWKNLQDTTRDRKKCAGNEPSQCGFVHRLNVRRTGKYDEMLLKTLRRKRGLVFRIQQQRRGTLPCIHTEKQGRSILWMILKEGSTVESGTKRGRMEASSSENGGSSRKSPKAMTDMIDDVVDHFREQVEGNVSTQLVRELLLGIERKTGIKVEQVMASCWTIPSRIREENINTPVSSITPSQRQESETVEEASSQEEQVSVEFNVDQEQEPPLDLLVDAWGDDNDDDDETEFCHLLGTQLDPIPPQEDESSSQGVEMTNSPATPQPIAPKAPPEERRSSPRKLAGKRLVDDFDADDDVEYDKASYTKVKVATKEDCSACDFVGKGTFFSCNLCSNNHRICFECMRFGNAGCKYEECRHACDGNYHIQTSNKKWMSSNKTKQCSKCSDQVTISKSSPVYYCLHCKLHRLCKKCWLPLTVGSEKKGRTRHNRSI